MFDSLWYLAFTVGLPLTALVAWMRFFIYRREKRSRRPFDQMPRPAGWSLQQRSDALFENFMETFFLAIAAGTIFSASAEKADFYPEVFLIIGFVACSLLMVRAARIIQNWTNYRLGLLGEQLVGHMLDQLASDSIRVFHDYEVREPGKKPWNIDHIVLTPAGVFAIETKTRRKPTKVAPDGQQGYKVIFDGQQLRYPAPMKSDRHGLDQAQRNAEWLSGKLGALNGNPVPVIPILALPGWYVELKAKGSVVVLNPKTFGTFLKGMAPALSAERQRAIGYQLGERCRIEFPRP